MPSIALVIASIMALSLVGLKLVGVSAHLPPNVAQADIVAENKAHAFQLRAEIGSEERDVQPRERADAERRQPALVRLSLNTH